MSKRILVIQGHPDSAVSHFRHALADAYAEGDAASRRRWLTRMARLGAQGA